MTNETKYRGFRIVPTDPVPPIPGWANHIITAVHVDYDGSEDRRICTYPSVEAARAGVDEWIADEHGIELTGDVDFDEASYLGDCDDGVYWQVWEDYDGQWYMSAVVDCDSAGFCDGLVKLDGPYESEESADQAGRDAAAEWCGFNNVPYDEDDDE